MRHNNKEVDKCIEQENTLFFLEQLAEIWHEEGHFSGFMEGLKIGERIKKHKVVEQLLQDSDFSVEKIASIADATLPFVKKVKKGY